VSGFLGRYEYQMDPKGRVSLPAAFRRDAEDGSFVLLQWERPYLTLFPQRAWETVRERLLEHRRSRSDAGRFLRRITSNAVEVSPDKQGRILIPSWLQEAAELDGTLLMVGAIDRIEIWDPEAFRRASPEESAELEDLAAQIFG